jgi:hypothetical protein
MNEVTRISEYIGPTRAPKQVPIDPTKDIIRNEMASERINQPSSLNRNPKWKQKEEEEINTLFSIPLTEENGPLSEGNGAFNNPKEQFWMKDYAVPQLESALKPNKNLHRITFEIMKELGLERYYIKPG